MISSASAAQTDSQLAQQYMAEGMPRELAIAKAKLHEQVKKKQFKDMRHKRKRKSKKSKS